MPNKDGKLHTGHRERMKERFLKTGFSGFSEHEILELLLFYSIPRRDTNPLAHTILDEYKSIANVFDADVESLSKIPGVGENSATLLSMIPHLARAYEQSKWSRDKLLHNTEAMGRFAVSMLQNEVIEKFALICVDSNRRVHWSGIIANGTLDRLEAYPRLVVSEVVKHNAKHVVFAHNHPNDSLTPSAADKETTRKLADLLRAMDVVVLDHIIVAGSRFYSLAESGFTF